jgi:hypothetical protein
MFRAKLWLATVDTNILITSAEKELFALEKRFEALLTMRTLDDTPVFSGGHIEQRIEGIGWVVIEAHLPDDE